MTSVHRIGLTLFSLKKVRTALVRVGLLVRLEAKPGKETEVARFLESGLALANQEPASSVWFALRLGPVTFGIFDAFADEAGSKAHLADQIAAALMPKHPSCLRRSLRSSRSTSLSRKPSTEVYR